MIFEELNGASSECRSYLVASDGEALLVDPLLERVPQYLERLRGLRLVYSVDTHTHADHLSGTKELSRRTGARRAGQPRSVAEVPLWDLDTLRVGSVTATSWASPGHTADSIVLLVPGRLIAGDTLFIGSTGRTDLPTGDAEAEWDSLQRVLALPDETEVWPGHEYNQKTFSTIGLEKRTNKRLQMGRDAFIAAMREPRPTKPKLLVEALAYNADPRT